MVHFSVEGVCKDKEDKDKELLDADTYHVDVQSW
jgi:hypothetical protein